MFHRVYWLCLSLAVCSCATYRPSGNGYKGVGAYKVPSDYSSSETEATERRPASDGLNTRYTPYHPLGLFQMVWPVQRIKINRGFKPATDPRHQGVDLGGKAGTPILAAHEGVVIYTGNEFRGYGNMMIVEYGDEWATLYAHLNHIGAETGQIVRAGDKIGTMGRTGDASGVHLHFELMHNRMPIDPLPYLTRSNRYAKK